MMIKKWRKGQKKFSMFEVVCMLVVVMLGMSVIGYAVPHEFIPGTTISSSQMNENFADLEARVAELEAKLSSVTVSGNDFIIEGKNVHIQSGCGSTDDTSGTCTELSGLGNLIIGYNETDRLPDDNDIRTGSHNLVIGPEHSYLSFGGLVAGNNNTISGRFSSVSGGISNYAGGKHSSISGGAANTATGDSSSVSGGVSNDASGIQSSINGGYNNEASGDYSSVSGGFDRSVSKSYDWRAGSLFEEQ